MPAPPVIEDALWTSPGPLLELPVDADMDPVLNAEAMFHSLAHWHPLLNGDASYWPAGFRERNALAARLPEPDALAELVRSTGLRLVWLHLGNIPPVYRRRWDAILTDETALRVLARAPGEVLFAVGPGP